MDCRFSPNLSIKQTINLLHNYTLCNFFSHFILHYRTILLLVKVDTTKRWEDDHSLNDLDKAYTNALLAYVRESVADYLTTPRFSPRNVHDEKDTMEFPPDPDKVSDKRDYLNQAILETVKREDEAESTLSRILLAGNMCFVCCSLC